MRSRGFLIYLRRRIPISLVVLIGISFLSFVMVYLLPGDPVSTRYPILRREDREVIRARMGLDQPLPVQYVTYMGALARGDMGVSYNTANSVSNDLLVRYPASLELILVALAIAVILGVPMGIVAAVKKNRLTDHAVRLSTVATMSVPTFWLGIILIILLFYQLKLVPAPIGRLSIGIEPPTNVTGLFVVDSILSGNWVTLRASLAHLMLPSIVLAASIIASVARITRAAVIDVLEEDYIAFARAIGVPERTVVYGDSLNNAKISIITMIGFVAAALIGGAAIVEKVFSWPGIGFYAVQAIVTSDHAAIQGVLIVIAVAVAVINLLVDLSYAYIDPRIRYA